MTASTGSGLSLVIPAYNEEMRITALFESIRQFGGELIVVCDGDDHTVDIVSRVASQRHDLSIRCLAFRQRLGKGGGVIEGIKAAQTPVVGFVDADGSTGIDEIVRLTEYLSDYECVIGSRWVQGSALSVPQGFLRRIESRIFNLLIRHLFSLDYSDTQCGAKVFRKSAVDTVLPAMNSRGFEFDVELLWRFKKAGFRIKEEPIRWQNRGGSRGEYWTWVGCLQVC